MDSILYLEVKWQISCIPITPIQALLMPFVCEMAMDCDTHIKSNIYAYKYSNVFVILTPCKIVQQHSATSCNVKYLQFATHNLIFHCINTGTLVLAS